MEKIPILNVLFPERAKTGKNIFDRGIENAKWEIRRFANDEDAKNRKVYTDAEAIRHFGRKQVSVIQEEKNRLKRIRAFVLGNLLRDPKLLSCLSGNLLLNEGINELTSLIGGTGGVQWDNTNAYLGVGDSSTAAAASQTGLQAVTNKVYVAMEAGFPTYGTSQQIAWKASYGSAVANWNWLEYTVANGNSDSDDNLNRKVEDEGTKTAGQTWELTLTITFS